VCIAFYGSTSLPWSGQVRFSGLFGRKEGEAVRWAWVSVVVCWVIMVTACRRRMHLWTMDLWLAGWLAVCKVAGGRSFCAVLEWVVETRVSE
jgi:hypothetical protein